MTASHSSSVMLTSMRSRRIPALLTSDVEPAEDVDGLADEGLAPVPGGDVVGVGHRPPAGGGDLVDHLLGRARVGAGPVPRPAQVVDHDVGAVLGQHQGVLPPDAPAGAGHDAGPALAHGITHRFAPPGLPSAAPAGPILHGARVGHQARTGPADEHGMQVEQRYRLVTRSDFDGLVCAVLLQELDLIDDITFVHPKDMQDGVVPITDRDITTNLPVRRGRPPGVRPPRQRDAPQRRRGRTTSSTPTRRRRPGSSTTTTAAPRPSPRSPRR